MKKTILIILLSFGFASADVKKEFHTNGTLKYISTSNIDNTSTRTIKTYYANGALEKEFTQIGSACSIKTYNTNGNLREETSFNNNKDCSQIK